MSDPLLPDATLDIDLGNTRLKFRCTAGSGAIVHSLPRALQAADAPMIDRALPDVERINRVRICSVLSANTNALIAQQVRKRWDCDCEFAASGAELAGVKNGYERPTQLGVDRWLALVAGYHHFPAEGLSDRPAVLVADLGTAATLDYVSGDGQHLGGYIVPGAQLMRRSLLQETAAIRFAATEQLSDLSPGRQTRDAVERGVLLSLVQLISAELERFDKLCDHNSRLVICGGDAERVSAHLQCDHEVVADLVLDGLAWALPND